MIAYASYYNPTAYKNKDETREQSAHNLQQHNYLDVDNKPIALDTSMMISHPWTHLAASSSSK